MPENRRFNRFDKNLISISKDIRDLDFDLHLWWDTGHSNRGWTIYRSFHFKEKNCSQKDHVFREWPLIKTNKMLLKRNRHQNSNEGQRGRKLFSISDENCKCNHYTCIICISTVFQWISRVFVIVDKNGRWKEFIDITYFWKLTESPKERNKFVFGSQVLQTTQTIFISHKDLHWPTLIYI